MQDQRKISISQQQTDKKLRENEPVVGKDVPDESKERHTEIAVEAGRTDAGQRDNKR